jgi:hypothetical protein
MGEVLHLFTGLVDRFPMREIAAVEVIQEKGLKGCIHGRPGSKRQVSLMDRETLDKFGLAPGVAKENITTQGMDFQSLATGNVLRIDDCMLEITGLAIRAGGWMRFAWGCKRRCGDRGAGCAG